MPKENINDIVADGFRAEVSWRPEERVCPDCGAVWQAPVPDCPECPRKNVPITSGHVQLATTSKSSPFVHPANPADPEGEPGQPHDGWYVTLDPAAIERTIDALMRAGAAAFPNWKRDWSSGGTQPESPGAHRPLPQASEPELYIPGRGDGPPQIAILGDDRPQQVVHFVGGPWAGKTTWVQGATGPVFSASHDVGKQYWLDTKSDPPTYHWLGPGESREDAQ